MSSPHRASQTYRAAQVRENTPRARLLMTYDAAIMAAQQGRDAVVLQALDLLERTLDPQADVMLALRLRGLYGWCRRCLESGDRRGVLRVLGTLRTAFALAPAGTDARVTRT